MKQSNGDVRHRSANGKIPETLNGKPVSGKNDIATINTDTLSSPANTRNLLICVGGIYASL